MNYYYKTTYHNWYNLSLQIYKSRGGHSYAVGEILTRDQAKEDLFLQEVQVKVFKRSGRLVLFEELYVVSLQGKYDIRF